MAILFTGTAFFCLQLLQTKPSLMEVKSLQNQFDLKELELSALLEITQAINDNLPEVSLYKIYGFILRANLQIKKLALFVKDEQWVCKENYGTNTDFFSAALDESFLELTEMQSLKHYERGGGLMNLTW